MLGVADHIRPRLRRAQIVKHVEITKTARPGSSIHKE
jgi:hypothetical protein